MWEHVIFKEKRKTIRLNSDINSMNNHLIIGLVDGICLVEAVMVMSMLLFQEKYPHLLQTYYQFSICDIQRLYHKSDLFQLCNRFGNALCTNKINTYRYNSGLSLTENSSRTIEYHTPNCKTGSSKQMATHAFINLLRGRPFNI